MFLPLLVFGNFVFTLVALVVFVFLIVASVVECCDRVFRARLRGRAPQDIETGRRASNDPVVREALERQPPKKEEASIRISAAGAIVVYKNQETESNFSDSCAVCLEEFKDGDNCRVLSKCEHLFHQRCIDLWLVKAMQCPLCRASLHGLEPACQIVGVALDS